MGKHKQGLYSGVIVWTGVRRLPWAQAWGAAVVVCQMSGKHSHTPLEKGISER